ncbi:MAG: hypothetical protein V4691_10635 [Pseudomonadota bacterium]
MTQPTNNTPNKPQDSDKKPETGAQGSDKSNPSNENKPEIKKAV